MSMGFPFRNRSRWGAALVALASLGCRESATPPAASSGSEGEAGAADETVPWNVLLVTLDTTRADHLSCFGYERKTTPHLDRLAEESVLFDLAISTSALTPMAHASILTGLYPHRHGVRVFWGPTTSYLEEGIPTLATVLREQGYRTGAFTSAYPASPRFGLQHGFDEFDSPVDESILDTTSNIDRGLMRQSGLWLREREGTAQRRGDETADRALRWLAETREPFLLWTHFFDPHDPALIPPEEYTEGCDIDPESDDALVAIYDPEIVFMDAQIERLFVALREGGLWERTVVVVIADHGQGLGDHGWFRHRLLYQETIRVPLLIRSPGGPGGTRVDRLVRNVDVLPTVLEVLGHPAPPRIDGESLVGLMRGESEQSPRIAFAEALNSLDEHCPRRLPPGQLDLLFVVMDQRWKLIHHRDEPANDELYDLDSDPGELRNVASEFPGQRTRLLRNLRVSGATEIRAVEPGRTQDAEERSQLEALGYIGDER